ncbi:hypothetical protein BDN67DRAFT_970852 [Paxillus ammoniavirescens]|nr:hypothetical protein BDN67DRAFT_970852 [Paxillus ammoniavirescens]
MMTIIPGVVRRVAERGRGGDWENHADRRKQPVTHPQPLHALEGHAARVCRLVSIPESNFFVSGSFDGGYRV